MDISQLYQLLLNTDQFELGYLMIEENEIRLEAESTAPRRAVILIITLCYAGVNPHAHFDGSRILCFAL